MDAAPPVKVAGAGPVVDSNGLPAPGPVPVADGAKVRVVLLLLLDALGAAMMTSLGLTDPVGAAISGRVLVTSTASLMEMAGRVAITTAVPRMSVRVTVKVEVEVEVVVGSLDGAGTASCGRAVASQGRRRRMEREREKRGGRIATARGATFVQEVVRVILGDVDVMKDGGFGKCGSGGGSDNYDNDDATQSDRLILVVRVVQVTF